MLVSRSPAVREDADALIVFTGEPNKVLTWSVIGPGVLSNIDQYSDSSGVATALFSPEAGDAGQTTTIRVSYRHDS